MFTSTTAASNMDNKAIDYLLLLLPLMGNRSRGTIGGRYNGCVLPLLVQLFFFLWYEKSYGTGIETAHTFIKGYLLNFRRSRSQ